MTEPRKVHFEVEAGPCSVKTLCGAPHTTRFTTTYDPHVTCTTCLRKLGYEVKQ